MSNKIDLTKHKIGMFAERTDCTEALTYAQSLLKHGANPASITTAIMVYHNTLINCLQETINSED